MRATKLTGGFYAARDRGRTNDRNRRSAFRSDFLRWADMAEIKPGTLDFLFDFVTRLSERQGAGGASASGGGSRTR
jgi:hypothetical protein